MSRKPAVSDILVHLSRATRDLTLHKPTPDQRRARAAFWASYTAAGGRSTRSTTHEGGLPSPVDAATPTLPGLPPATDLATALRYGGDRRITEWWVAPGFTDWWSNSEEFSQRIEYLAQLALDDLEEILATTTVRPGYKLAAAKMILEIGGKFPRSRPTEPEQYVDGEVSKMGRAELERFIARRIPAPQQLTPGDVPATVIDSNPVDK